MLSKSAVQRSSTTYARSVLDDLVALDEVSVFEPHLTAGTQPEILGRRRFHEIVALDEQLAAEGNLALAGIRVLGVVDGFEFLDLAFRVVGDDDFERPQHRQPAQRVPVQVLANAILQHGNIRDAVVFGDADVIGEIAQGLRGDAAAAQAADGRHSGIVPARNEALVDELHELALAHHRVAEAQAGELYW